MGKNKSQEIKVGENIKNWDKFDREAEAEAFAIRKLRSFTIKPRGKKTGKGFGSK